MALTGLVFIFFVLMHMYGNLKILWSRHAFDEYAHHLRTFLTPIFPYEGFLWCFRIFLLVCVALHVWAAISTWKQSAAARREKYSVKKNLKASLSSRTMRWGGTALLLFIIFHLLHFTTHTVKTWEGDAHTPADKVIDTFQQPLLVIVYLLALVALGLHLMHGTWSFLTTLGFNRENRTGLFKLLGWLVAAVVVIGFAIPPLAILFGMAPIKTY